jgi:Uncharacterized conserved protein
MSRWGRRSVRSSVRASAYPVGAWLTCWRGASGADLYGETDADLLRRVGGLIAAQVAVLVTASALPSAPAAPQAPKPSLLEAAELLATGTEFAETTRRVADLAGRVLPFDEIRFAIRLSEGDRVVLLEPGERRPLPDLPLVPVAGTTLAAVLQGEIPSSFQLVQARPACWCRSG